jgi:hypothetical protein
LSFLIGDLSIVIESSQSQGRQMTNDKSQIANDKFSLAAANHHRIYEFMYLVSQGTRLPAVATRFGFASRSERHSLRN